MDIVRFRPDVDARRRILDRLGWHADDRVVGFLGRFVEAKGIHLLLDALRSLRGSWRGLFVGGGPLEGALRRFAGEYPGRVHVETGVPHDDVPAWLNAMSVLCAPSQTTPAWREQFGRMLIEAMACGVAVIAGDSGEMPWVVGDAGVVIGEADLPAWTATIDRLLGDDAVRREHAAKGLERVHERFAWSVVARSHLEFFDTLIDGGPL